MKLLLIIGLMPAICFGQIKNDSVAIDFNFPKHKLNKPADFNLSVSYKNLSARYVQVYESLVEGEKGDQFCNISIEMEKESEKMYKYYPIRYYQNPNRTRFEDSLRHYDLPKLKLSPNKVRSLMLNLLDLGNSFEPGNYRFKAHLRVKTKRDNRVYNDVKGETEPPRDDISYVVSQWIYFNVPIYVHAPHKE